MGIVHHPNIVTDGLAACWDGANRKSYPETGALWTDIAGNNIGTFVNEAAFDSDNMGTISLDGTDDYVTVPNNDVFDYAANYSVSCWVYVDTKKSCCILSTLTQGVAGQAGWAIGGYAGSDDGFSFYPDGTYNSSGGKALGGTNFSAGVWYHIVVTWDYNASGPTGSSKIYLNGVLDGTTSYPYPAGVASSQALVFGRFYPNYDDWYFSGRIANVLFYQSTLSADEVVQNYNATKTRFYPNPSDSLIFKMDAGDKRSYPGTGTTWTDLAQGNVGTFASSPSFSTDAGGAMLLDGTDDYLEIASPGTSYRPATEMTLSAWIKPDDFGSEAPILSKWHSSDGNWGSYSMRVATDADWKFTVQNETGSDYPYWTSNQTARRILTSEWNYVTAVWRGAIAGAESDATIYLNGEPYTALYTDFSAGGYGASFTTEYSTYKLVIGARAGWFFDGAIAYASVHERALTDAEVLNSYNKTKGRFV